MSDPLPNKYHVEVKAWGVSNAVDRISLVTSLEAVLTAVVITQYSEGFAHAFFAYLLPALPDDKPATDRLAFEDFKFTTKTLSFPGLPAPFPKNPQGAQEQGRVNGIERTRGLVKTHLHSSLSNYQFAEFSENIPLPPSGLTYSLAELTSIYNNRKQQG